MAGGGLLLVAATLFLPYFVVQPGYQTTGGPQSYADLVPTSEVGYEFRLVHGPPLLSGVMAGTGLALGIRRVARTPLARDACLWLGGASGALCLLAGMRWLGFFVARLMDNGPPPIQLHVVPYLEIGVGAGVAAMAWRRLRSLAGRGPSLFPLAAMATLVMVPTLPFAVQTSPPSFARYFDEWTLAIVAHAGEPAQRAAAAHLSSFRICLWVILAAGLAEQTFGPLAARRSVLPPWLPAALWILLLMPWLLALAFLALFIHDAGQVAPQVKAWPNPVPWFGMAWLLVVWTLGLRRRILFSGGPK